MYTSIGSVLHETWGSSSYPEMAAGSLNLNRYLAEVPQNGLVADLGAGIGQTLAASIYAVAPDITTISVDTGYIDSSLRELINEAQYTVGLFDSEDAASNLSESEDWRNKPVAAFVEELPFKDESVDLVTSYACVPEYSNPISEVVRIMKVGAVALLGPMRTEVCESLIGGLESCVQVGEISSKALVIQGPFGDIDCHTVVFRKDQ